MKEINVDLGKLGTHTEQLQLKLELINKMTNHFIIGKFVIKEEFSYN